MNEADVTALVDAAALTDALEEVFRSLAAGQTVQEPRLRVRSGKQTLHNLGAVSDSLGVAALKSYTAGPNGVRFITLLFELASNSLLAVIESGRLGQLRTGCATALAYRWRVGRPAARMALIGTGTVALGQLEALLAEAHPAEVRVFSRKPENRRDLIEQAARLGQQVQDCDNAQACLDGADLVVTATTSAHPVVLGSWLGPAGFLAAVGSNWANRRELDDEAVRRCQSWVVDDRAQARQEAGDFLLCPDFAWDQLRELAAVVGEKPADLTGWTGFKSLGVACEDLAVAHLVYRRARERGVGQALQ